MKKAIVIFLGLLLICAFPVYAAGPLNLVQQVDLTTGLGVTYPPFALTYGKFCFDSTPILAVANYNNGTISIFLSNGNGTFTPAATPSFAVTSPFSIVAADFNGDNKLDLAVADFQSTGRVYIFFGDGNGGFAPAPTPSYTVGQQPTSIAVGDFNGDGRPDLAVTNSGNVAVGHDTVSILLNDPGSPGTFSMGTPIAFATNDAPYSVVAGDFDNDGKIDIAIARFGVNTVSIYKGNGDGTFTPFGVDLTAVAPTYIAAGDFNGDGKLDLAVTRLGGTTVSVFLGDGTGGFSFKSANTVGTTPTSIVVADFNNDGKLDMAVSNNDSIYFSIAIGKGDGTFETPYGYAPTGGGSMRWIVAGDFNNDGMPDIAVANGGFHDTVSVFLNTTFRDVRASSLNFGYVALGSSEDRDLTIRNTGNADVTVTDISISESGTPNFSVVSGGSCGTPPFLLAYNSSCTIRIKFQPTGAKEATLLVWSYEIFPLAYPTLMGNYPPIELPKTGQTSCYDASGNPLIPCTNSGQDGDKLAGAQWPTPRFTPNTLPPDNGLTETDNLTGLVWMKNADTPANTVPCTGGLSCDTGTHKCVGGVRSWQGALDYITCLNDSGAGAGYLGHNDWRLPNINELESLVNAEFEYPSYLTLAGWLNEFFFVNVSSATPYWSSTTKMWALSQAWQVGMAAGEVGSADKAAGSALVWPVRNDFQRDVPNAAYPSNVWKTGQTGCYDSAGAARMCFGTGEDGDWQWGITWPTPRFDDKGDAIVDRLANLMWLKESNCIANKYPSFDSDGVVGDGAVRWQAALNFVSDVNDGVKPDCSAGYNDWRLPNKNELFSLADMSGPSTWLPAPFTNLQSKYWSSTNFIIDPTAAWEYDTSGSRLGGTGKANAGFVMMVRGIQKISAPASISFGSVDIGTSSTPETVTISNTGKGALKIGTITVSANFGIKSGTDACSGQTLAPGASCALAVVFTPGLPSGTQTGTLTIPSDDLDMPSAGVDLTGDAAITAGWTLSVTKDGPCTAGTITSSEATPLISCGPSCTSTFALYPSSGAPMSTILTVTPAPGCAFKGWSGDCAGMTCSPLMDMNKTVTAIFDYIGFEGAASEGNLKIVVRDDGNIGLYRYVNGAWQNQVFSGDSKSLRLLYNMYSVQYKYSGEYFSATGDNPITLQSAVQVSPTQISATWNAGMVNIVEDISYVSGNDSYSYKWTVKNNGGSDLTDLRFFHGEDTYLRGGDNGAGYWKAPDTVGVGKHEKVSGREFKMYLKGITIPYAYDSMSYSSVLSNVKAGALTNTLDFNEGTDNGYALEWRLSSLAPYFLSSTAWTIEAVEGFYDAPVNIAAPAGSTCGEGLSCDLKYTLVNSSASDKTVAALSSSASQAGWTAVVVSPSLPMTLPVGGRQYVVVRVSIPSGTSEGAVSGVTLSATIDSALYEGMTQVTSAKPVLFTVKKLGNGSGAITSRPAGLVCDPASNICSGLFSPDSSVYLTASSDASSVFAGWGEAGSGCAGGSRCRLYLGADSTVTATFNAKGSLLDDWKWKNPIPQGNDLAAAAYGKGKYVAVGNQTIMTSTDGANWTVADAAAALALDFGGITYGEDAPGKDIFVAVGDGVMATSPDGVSWTVGDSLFRGALNAVTYDKGLFVAAGNGGAILTSPDGINWTERASGTSDDIFGISFGAGMFVAACGNTILTSPDGLNWAPQGSGYWLKTVACSSTACVVAGEKALMSPTPADLASWIDKTPLSSSGNFAAAAYGKGNFVVEPYKHGENLLLIADNGAVSNAALPGKPMDAAGMNFGGNIFMAFRYSGQIYTSPDGSSWTVRTSGQTGQIYRMIYANNTYMAAGVGSDGGSVWFSPDAVGWTAKDVSDADYLNGVAYGNNAYVAIGGFYDSLTETYDGEIFSYDGSAWVLKKTAEGGTFTDVVYGGGVFVVVGGPSGILWSTDGISWNIPEGAPSEGQLGISAVAYGNGFVAIGEAYKPDTDSYDVTVFTSADGKSWSSSAVSSIKEYIIRLAFSNGRFFALTELSGSIYSSPDGSAGSWTKADTGFHSPIYDVAYGDGNYVAVGASGAVLASPDGISWGMRKSLASNELFGVVFANSLFTAVGKYGTVIQPLPSTFSIAITPSSNGSLTCTPSIVSSGGSAVCTAKADSGYHTASVTGCGGSLSGDTYAISSLAGPCTVTAEFAVNKYNINIAAGPNGTITGPASQVINYGGGTVSVKAAPDAGYYFVNWAWSNGVDTSTANPLTIGNVTKDMNIKAIFAVASYNLAVTKTGNGTITDSNLGINCGNNCTKAYDPNTQVTLVAKADAGWSLTAWTGCDKTSGNYCVVTMDSNKTVAAVFEKNVPQIDTPPPGQATETLDFGSIKVGKLKNMSYKITNKGKTYITISARIEGTDAEMFSAKPAGKKTIKPKASYAIRLTFKPGSEGSKAGTLRINFNNPEIPDRVITLQGEGTVKKKAAKVVTAKKK